MVQAVVMFAVQLVTIAPNVNIPALKTRFTDIANFAIFASFLFVFLLLVYFSLSQLTK